MRLEIESIPPMFAENFVSEPVADDKEMEAKEALREGIKAAQSGDRAKARVALFRSADLDPKSESAWLWLASISEYPEELLVFLTNVLEINPLNARATEWMAATKSLLAKTFVQRGVDAMQEGQPDFAAQCFNQALEHDQKNSMAWLWLASLSDSNEGKMSYLEKVLELEPDNQAALSAYHAAKEDNHQKLLNEARTAAVSGHKSEANELLDAFIAENPDSEDGWILRSHLADSFDDKIAAFERVLLINPENVTARAGLDSLNAIKQTVAPKVEEIPVMNETAVMSESTSMAIDAERWHETESAHDKSPTQDLVWPVAMEPETNGHASFEENESDKEVVYFDTPEMADVPEITQEEPQTENTKLDSFEPSDDWSMNTAVFNFSMAGFGGAPAGETTEEPVEMVNDSFDFTVPAPIPEPMSAEDDDALYESVSFSPEVAEASEPVAEIEVEKPAENIFAASEDEAEDRLLAVMERIPMPDAEELSFAPSDGPATHESEIFSFAPVDSISMPEAEEFSFASAESSMGNGNHEASNGNGNVAYKEPMIDEVEQSPVAFEQSIPMPPLEFSFPDTFSGTTGFETNVIRQDNGNHSSAAAMNCPFCEAENPAQAFACSSCLSMLTLSDLEMLLANTHADKLMLRESVERMEAERKTREFSESELTTLGIGHLNLRNLQTGYQYLQEASALNPNNVVLSSQVNALHIRLDEIERQTEVHDAMPKGKTILVVDDSPTVRKLIAGKLEKCGHEVFCSNDGVEAMDLLKGLTPDLVLLDINMPRMDGYQACKLIRGNEATKDVPVVMISGKDGFFDKVRGRMAGTSGYITKPFGPETLMKAVETYLKGEQQ